MRRIAVIGGRRKVRVASAAIQWRREWPRLNRRGRSASSGSASWAAPSRATSRRRVGGSIGHDIDPKACRAAARAGVEIAKGIHDLAAKAPVIITSLPHPAALHDTVAAIVAAKVKPRILVEASTFTLDDKLKAERALRKAGHTMLDCPISGTGSQAKVKDVVVYASGDTRAIRKLKPMFAALLTRRARPRRVRKFQPDEIRRQSPGRDPQHRHRRSHGARHEGGPRSQGDLRDDQDRRRKFARVRAARTDDGQREIRRRHHEGEGLAEGHAGDRRLRQGDRLPDAAVHRDRRHLRPGAEIRLRHAGHRRGVRGDGKNGRREAARGKKRK